MSALTLALILRRTAERHGFEPQHVQGPGTMLDLCVARREFVWLAGQLTAHNMLAIGTAVARDHAFAKQAFDTTQARAGARPGYLDTLYEACLALQTEG